MSVVYYFNRSQTGLIYFYYYGGETLETRRFITYDRSLSGGYPLSVIFLLLPLVRNRIEQLDG